MTDACRRGNCGAGSGAYCFMRSDGAQADGSVWRPRKVVRRSKTGADPTSAVLRFDGAAPACLSRVIGLTCRAGPFRLPYPRRSRGLAKRQRNPRGATASCRMTMRAPKTARPSRRDVPRRPRSTGPRALPRAHGNHNEDHQGPAGQAHGRLVWLAILVPEVDQKQAQQRDHQPDPASCAQQVGQNGAHRDET